MTIVNQTTLAFQNLVSANGKSIDKYYPRAVIFGGEACPADIAVQWSNHCAVLHAYGPTETTVFASMTAPLSTELTPPIGKPISEAGVAEAAETALQLAKPLKMNSYKVELSKTLVRRALLSLADQKTFN